MPIYYCVCLRCSHFISPFKCKAFERIPTNIIIGKDNHLIKLPDQKNNIVFKESKIAKSKKQKEVVI